ncbi:MAG TPA: OmpA family protein [Burkholderiaceae bacterium]
MLKNRLLLPVLLFAAAILSACSSTPRENVVLTQARADFVAAQNTPAVMQLAPSELKDAGLALDQANAAAAKRENDDTITNLAYVAKQKIATAVEIAKTRSAEQSMSAAERERQRLQLDQRTAEADRARMAAAAAQNQAANAQAQAANANAQAANAQQQAADAQAQAAEAQARARQMEIMLVALAATKTERGMVVTLSDVLFAVNRAELTPDGMRTVQKLADFMKQFPQRSVLIEGYTDSTGTSAHNMDLSNRRAESVATALAGMGVARDRIATKGYGEAYPVASNDNAGNRQRNRRVEIVLSEDNQRVSPR